MAVGRKAPRTPLEPGRDDALNDQIHAVLRDAAEALSERTRAQAASDAAAARHQLDAIFALTRGRDRSARR